MAVGTADYSIKTSARRPTREIEGFLEVKEELFNLRFQSATGQLENTARLRLSRATSPGCTPCFASVSLSARPPGATESS